MSIREVQKAVRRHLKTASPDLPTAQENIPFEPPATMYQRLQFVISRPTDPTYGTYFYRENIEAQVFIVDQLDIGMDAVITRAELVRDLFNKGLTLEEGGVRMHVLRTPQIAGAVVAADRVIVPVLIAITAEVYE
jgi:hypothetical protein